jgi:predicted 3-demethylubiquinone-9 3-methyltransferase (glyoxalase superfamily)
MGKSKTERVIFLSGFSYKEQYAVVVICKDEKEQETIYNRLKAEGFKLKVVAV